MNEIKILNEQEVLGKQFKVYGTPDNPLFLAKDVAKWIDLSNVTDMVSRVDSDEVTKLNLGGLQGECNFLTEDGLYEVLMQSRKPIAKQFKKKVKEILKDIRKHGIYATDKVIDDILNNPDFGIELLTKLKAERKAKERLQQELDRSKDWYSIKRVAALNRVSWKTFDWRRLKETGARMGYGVKKIFDANYGEVNTYHKNVWEKAYPNYEL